MTNKTLGKEKQKIRFLTKNKNKTKTGTVFRTGCNQSLQ